MSRGEGGRIFEMGSEPTSGGRSGPTPPRRSAGGQSAGGHGGRQRSGNSGEPRARSLPPSLPTLAQQDKVSTHRPSHPDCADFSRLPRRLFLPSPSVSSPPHVPVSSPRRPSRPPLRTPAPLTRSHQQQVRLLPKLLTHLWIRVLTRCSSFPPLSQNYIMSQQIPSVKLSNGADFPLLGFGCVPSPPISCLRPEI